jgi:hypothetical protein
VIKRPKLCRVFWCQNISYIKGLCPAHYQTLRRYGSETGETKSYVEKEATEIRNLLEKLTSADSWDGDGACTYCKRWVHEHDKDCPLILAREKLRYYELKESGEADAI